MFRRPLLKFVLAVVARPRLTLAVAGAALAACVVLSMTRLGVSTDQNKLFSDKVPFFRDWLEFDRQFPENDALYVVVEVKEPKDPKDPKDPARPPPSITRWAAAADAVVASVKALPPRVVTSVEGRVPLDELGHQGLLFQDAADLPATLEEVKQFTPLTLLWGGGPQLLTTLIGAQGRTPTGRFLSAMRKFPIDADQVKFVGALADSWNYALDHPGDAPRVGRGLPDLVAMQAGDPSDLGYYYVPDETDHSRNLLLVRVFPADDPTSLTAGAKNVEAIRKAVDEAATSFPEFTFGTTGRPALDADESRTTDHDSKVSEIVALSAVFLGLVWALRSLWLALAAEICLAVGIGWTFGWATVTVHELNLLSTVFLIALIGIGMDYLVQVLMRYRQESARRGSARRVWVAVFKHVAPPINTACLGAAGAFLVSAFTDFRGAADLGIIAGGGLLLCLLSGYTVLPALLVLFPAKPNPNFAPPAARATPPAPPPPPGADELGAGVLSYSRLAPRESRARVLFPPALWVVALALAVPFMLRARFDPGLLHLQAPDLPSVKLIEKLQTWSAVALSKDLDQLRRARQALQGSPTVKDTESLLGAYDNYDWLRQHAADLPNFALPAPAPVEPEDLAGIESASRGLASRYEAAAASGRPGLAREARAAAESLRAFADQLERVRPVVAPGSTRPASPPAARAATAPTPLAATAAGTLSAWQAGFVGELRNLGAQFRPGPVKVESLPPALRRHLVSDAGVYALYINPRKDLWNQWNLDAFVRDVESRVPRPPDGPVVTGIAPDIYHSTRAIQKSFYQATAFALGLILLLVGIDLRRTGQTLLAVSVLALGLPMLVGLMGLFRVSWNFANFFALPILIGAGHEYGVFMVHRYREALADPRRDWRGWDVSDRALLLCAFVTSTSFGFFWFFGHHRGLRSLGLVMALGTACIYLATLCVLRPVLLWRLKMRGRGGR